MKKQERSALAPFLQEKEQISEQENTPSLEETHQIQENLDQLFSGENVEDFYNSQEEFGFISE